MNIKRDILSRTVIFIFSLLLIITTQFAVSCKLDEPSHNKTKKDKTDKTDKTDNKKDDDTGKPLGSKQLQVHMLDIGQGDSLLIITPEKKIVLIDAGLAKAGAKVVEKLKEYNINTIDLAVATHPHADHIGGMPKVLEAVTVKKFLDSGQSHPTATYAKLLETVKEKIGGLTVARLGQEFELDSGIELKVLGPSEPLLDRVSGSVENANSVIIMLTYGNFKMLFTGDSEDETETRLLEKAVALKAQVLKVAHHGSQYATTDEFLKKVSPETAIISCGEDNNYGHPAPPTLDKLKKANIKTYRTDLQGEITIISDGKNYQVKTEHAATGDIWTGRTSSKKSKS
jgi:beta-lactamase superfamily II metal-dependent hydrolase